MVDIEVDLGEGRKSVLLGMTFFFLLIYFQGRKSSAKLMSVDIVGGVISPILPSQIHPCIYLYIYMY